MLQAALTFEPAHTIHQVDQARQQTTKGSCNRSGREEQGDSEVDLVSTVPHGEVEGNTREETCLGDAELQVSGCSSSLRAQPVKLTKTRAIKRPVKFCTIPVRVMTTPQASMISGSHRLGRQAFMTMLLCVRLTPKGSTTAATHLGTSKRT